MKRLLAILLLAATAHANDISFHSLQSGWRSVATPLTDHGLHGEGQIIAVLDTGVDYDNCYFAEADRSRPPVNLGSPTGVLEWRNVDLSRRKIVAYDFLWSCAQYPLATGCDDPINPFDYDNNGHGTHNAAAAVGAAIGAPGLRNPLDALASAAKLIVQDGGLVNGDNCSQRPGFGCPVNLIPILDQAYKQGARIHSNSWGDRQGTGPFTNPPTANYSPSARDLDAFVASHPDMLIVFDTGNYGSTASIPANPPPAMSVAAPGSAKNVLQVGGTRPNSDHADDTLSYNTLYGPTRDGRIKPDVVGPSSVTSATGDRNVTTDDCIATTEGPGTSWAAPTIAGAAALVRQYYMVGFYPTGRREPAHAMSPSAALLKATIIASARRVPIRMSAAGDLPTAAVPSYEQGFGFPVLDDALYFEGDRARLRVVDVANDAGLASEQTVSLRLSALSGTPLKVVLVWTDPAGVPRTASDPTPEIVHDLDLRVSGPGGLVRLGNDSLHQGQPDRLNNVEAVSIPQPVTGDYTFTINAARVGAGLRQGYALVVTGDVTDALPGRSRSVRRR